MKLFLLVVLSAVYVIWAPVVLADVLVSKSREPESQIVADDTYYEESVAAPAKRKVRLKFRPKNAVEPMAQETTSYLAPDEDYTAYEEQHNSGDPLEFSDEDPEGLSQSQSTHPLAVRVEDASPVRQVVSGPRTNYYGNPRPASVVYPGKQSGGMTARVVQAGSSSTTDQTY